MSIKSLIVAEVEEQLTEINKMELGSTECKIAIDGCVMLVKTAMDIDKFEAEQLERELTRKMETDLRQQEIDNERKDKLLKNVITVVTLAAGVTVTVWGVLHTEKFEETEVLTGTAQKNFAREAVNFFKKWF